MEYEQEWVKVLSNNLKRNADGLFISYDKATAAHINTLFVMINSLYFYHYLFDEGKSTQDNKNILDYSFRCKRL